MKPTLKISKTDAAKRQLETAIRLWFNDGEPASIHTLTAAAHQIVHDLGKARGISALLRDLETTKPEYKKRVQKIIARYENFLKHADKDPDAYLDFNPEVSKMYILDAVMTYQAITKETPHIFRAFTMWMKIQCPELVNDESREEFEKCFKQNPTISSMGKSEFLTVYLAVLSKNDSVTSFH